MELLASGRDCDVFDLGDGTVLRRKRDGGSLEREAAVLRHAAAHGVPCPAVHRATGSDLVLDLVPGPTLLDDLLADATPERAAAAGSLLAEVHGTVHRAPPPDVDGAGTSAAGDVLVHLDLHPGNVLLGPDGPVVIDWVNAAGGQAALDVADTWLVVGAIGALLPGAEPLVEAFLATFLGALDRDAAAGHLGLAAAARCEDPHLSDEERAGMQRLADEHGR